MSTLREDALAAFREHERQMSRNQVDRFCKLGKELAVQLQKVLGRSVPLREMQTDNYRVSARLEGICFTVHSSGASTTRVLAVYGVDGELHDVRTMEQLGCLLERGIV